MHMHRLSMGLGLTKDYVHSHGIVIEARKGRVGHPVEGGQLAILCNLQVDAMRVAGSLGSLVVSLLMHTDKLAPHNVPSMACDYHRLKVG